MSGLRRSESGGRQWLYPELAFGGFSRRDGTVAFYTRVSALVTSTFRILDYGCGTGAHYAAAAHPVQAIRRLRGRVAEVLGADVDPACAGNPYIDKFLLIKGSVVPLPSRSVDLCVTDWTLEHLSDVEAFFRECARVIRPGGILCIRTPNRWHYSSIVARTVPFRYHQAIRRWMGQFHTEADVFPTLYRCNSRRQLRRRLRTAGFSAVVYSHRGDSHLAGVGRLSGVIGEAIEWLSPPFLCHELHAFGRLGESPGTRNTGSTVEMEGG